MLYIFKKIWYLIFLLLLSTYAFFAKTTDWVIYPFLFRYFRFAWYVVIMGGVANLAGRFIPRKFNFESGLFAPHKWEKNGKIYQEKLKIKSWKDSMMDMSKASEKAQSKDVGQDLSSKHLYTLLQETCVAEVVHIALIILGLSLLFFIEWPYNLFWEAAYLVFNSLDIIIQRYNRPRLVSIYKRALRMEGKGK
ncbi:MAG: hypothetical protein K6F82_06645 [Sphaerochaetaceae bacterium]|nr:hypothetical protein [Sphaerochaetaceae bacterium]